MHCSSYSGGKPGASCALLSLDKYVTAKLFTCSLISSRMLVTTFIDLLLFDLCARGGWLGGPSTATDLQVRSVAGCGHWQCRTLEHALWCMFRQQRYVCFFPPNIFVLVWMTLLSVLVKWGWLVSSVEWCVFVCNHNARGAQWKNSFTESPVWVQAVMAKGMATTYVFLFKLYNVWKHRCTSFHIALNSIVILNPF